VNTLPPCPVTAEQNELLEAYLRLILEKNKVMNLTAVTDWDEAVTRHLLDSRMGGALLPEGAYAADVGTGAGLPGLPLAILRPDTRWVLADSLKKRVDFLAETVGRLGLSSRVQALWIRAEDMGRDPSYREKFDIGVCRALAPLKVSLEYLLPLVKPNGTALFWKGSAAREEAHDAARALRLLGGQIQEFYPYRLPGQEAEFSLIEVKKVRPTPPAYPRKAGTPAKTPL